MGGMVAKLKKLFLDDCWAHEVTDPNDREMIIEQYRKRYPEPVPNPATHPWLFDPLNPPDSWRYDPYYETWINTNNFN
jgi:hypothetical protein